MTRVDIASAQASDYTNTVQDFAITPKNTDGINNQGETEYINPIWTRMWGYFLQDAEIHNAISMKSIWDVGGGWEADPETTVILDHITGAGKDTFDDILLNMIITMRVGRDSFAEIIRDEKSGTLINLKPLDPGSIKIIYDRKGIIKRYEQNQKLPGSQPLIFQPNEILHFSNKRIADQIHGLSDIEIIEEIIKADQESFTDMKKIMHRQARPLILWKLKTDDTSKINSFVAKINNARNLGEDMFIPDDESVVSHELVEINLSNAIFEWRNDLRKKFYRVVGLPELLPSGGGDSTESGGKIGYLAFERLVEKSQRYVEKQIWAQLGLKINLIAPATLEFNLQNDRMKDANQGLEFQPGDTTAGVGA